MFFAPQAAGQHVAPIGVKFGVDEWTMPNFTPISAGMGLWTKLKILLKFHQISYPLFDFRQICRFVRRFKAHLPLEFGWNCSMAYGVMGVKLNRAGFSRFFTAPPPPSSDSGEARVCNVCA